VRSAGPFAPANPRPCIFEHVCFSRPDSIIEGTSVYEVRKNIGARLARGAINAGFVVPVPDSGVPAALGFSRIRSRSNWASSAPTMSEGPIQPSETSAPRRQTQHNANRA
jgi:glutamine phosphoribosylpyrophosphate amidotransferase